MSGTWSKSRRVWELLRVQFDVPLPEFHVEPLDIFDALIQEWNPLCKLLSKRDSQVLDDHVADSWALLPYVPQSAPQQHFLDIGSGGGLPGIPIALARPRLEVHLLDRGERKTAFQRRVAIALGLSNVTAICGDLAGHLTGEPCTAVFTARAIERPAALKPQFDELVGRGAIFLCQSREALPDRHRYDVREIWDVFSEEGLRRGDLAIVTNR